MPGERHHVGTRTPRLLARERLIPATQDVPSARDERHSCDERRQRRSAAGRRRCNATPLRSWCRSPMSTGWGSSRTQVKKASPPGLMSTDGLLVGGCESSGRDTGSDSPTAAKASNRHTGANRAWHFVYRATRSMYEKAPKGVPGSGRLNWSEATDPLHADPDLTPWRGDDSTLHGRASACISWRQRGLRSGHPATAPVRNRGASGPPACRTTPADAFRRCSSEGDRRGDRWASRGSRGRRRGTRSRRRAGD